MLPQPELKAAPATAVTSHLALVRVVRMRCSLGAWSPRAAAPVPGWFSILRNRIFAQGASDLRREGSAWAGVVG
ncbi:hypothetical protein GCM10022295_49950 [Streptomyces osmaniensis]|uniref:Uncharacterized protein n=1 Tax=Streptomyces osmaniensis TaxID=593134 RepID=A0ABP6X7T9_9ACTN